MRILHLSDLHFGTETQDLQRDLIAHIKATPADLAIISGDFTQIGSNAEFKKARNFLDGLDMPVFCIPGNHDIPRMNLMGRLFDPYRRYKRHINNDLCPVLRLDGVTIAGINTARRILPHWNWAHGAVSRAQIKHLHDVFAQAPDDLKICVMHHPVQKAADHNFNTIVYGSAHAMKALEAMTTDIILTGHTHHASVTTIESETHRMVFLSASTALSTRLRLHKNGYNTIDIHPDRIVMNIFSYENGKFDCQQSLEYTREHAPAGTF